MGDCDGWWSNPSIELMEDSVIASIGVSNDKFENSVFSFLAKEPRSYDKVYKYFSSGSIANPQG